VRGLILLIISKSNW